ncbi:hypothetical protein [Sulfuriroseicoccus oceanibius]|uniref:CHASE2 domain-containing protein n=1 Tax=Sulfuriroseicoccus oceanibius TaxID=2707525 RepID=A0A6B3L6K1_9BACT|nr:hypothetical protein [Sulfuriroseicoccus oceanibius]QQL45843.1 hypothetical protein G3M56_004460 [Sulfuriroseicoccus oceanibius]
MTTGRSQELPNRVSIWKKIAGVWVVLFVLGFVLEREQGRGGVVDGWNDWVSREVVNANRDVLVPEYYRWVDLERERDLRMMGEGVDDSAADKRIVYSGSVRDGEWMPGDEVERVVGVEFSADDASTFNQWPPGPVDYAVVLDQLNSMRCAAIGVVSPLQWWDAPEVYFHSLRSQIQQAKSPLVLSLGLTDVAEIPRGDEVAPVERALVELPLTSVSGDGQLIEVAGVLDEADERLGELPGVRSGFTNLSVGTPLPDPVHGRVKVPLLAMRGDRVVVGLPLALPMAADRVKPSEVTVVLGDSVRWRDRRVPIDEAGCYDVPVADAVRNESDWVSAVRFVAPPGIGDDAAPDVTGKVVLIARDAATIPTTGGGVTSVADLQLAVARAIDSGEHRAPVVVFSQLPDWAYWLMLAIVPVLTTLVLWLRLSKAAAALVFLIVLAVFFMVYAHLVGAERVLVPTATPLGVWAAGLCASFLSTKWRVTTSSRDARRREKMAALEDA